jgi:predicted nucleotidyltransferase
VTEPELVRRLSELLLAHAAVRSVRLVGSRADGRATALSDVDLLVDADLDELQPDLAALVAPLEPLAAQWDRLSEEASYFMLVLPGGIKVDLVFDVPPTLEPPWRVSAATLPGIDAHFWDWILWLGGKQLAGRAELVASMLGGIMFEHLLRPLGVGEPPATIDGAVRGYLAARDAREAELGVTVGRELQEAVLPRLRAAGIVEAR